MRIGRIRMAAAAALSLAAACAGAPQLMHSRPDTDGALEALQAEGFTETPTGDSLPVDRETARDLAEARQRLQTSMPAPAPTPQVVAAAPTSLSAPATDNGFRCKRAKAPDGSATYYCTHAGDAVRVSADTRSGTGSREMFTVRRIVGGEGVERKFPLHSPKIAKVDVKRSGVSRRAKLYYLRDRVGKAVRLREKRDEVALAAGAAKKAAAKAAAKKAAKA